MFWSSADEIETLMKGQGIKFEKVALKKISGLSQAYIERYSLNDDQIKLLTEIMADKDYLIQTTWVYPVEISTVDWKM